MPITSQYLWSPSGSLVDLIDLRDVVAWNLLGTDPTLVGVRLMVGFGSYDGSSDGSDSGSQVLVANARDFEAAMNNAYPIPAAFTVDTARVAPGGSTNVTLLTEFRLPLNPGLSGYNFQIEWGDGSTDVITNSLAAVPTIVSTAPAPGAVTSVGTYIVAAITTPYVLHTYAASGVYQILITSLAVGGFPAVHFADNLALTQVAAKATDAFKINTLDAWGNGRWLSMLGALQGANFMTTATLTDIATADHAGVATWDRAFTYCKVMTVFPAADLSGATDITSICNGCSVLAVMPFVDVSEVVKANFAWVGCTALTSFPALDLGNNLNFSGTWNGCAALTAFPVMDVGKGTTFQNCWIGCAALTAFPALDFTSATIMGGAWQNCTAMVTFTSINFPLCVNFSNAWRNTAIVNFPLMLFGGSNINFLEAWRFCPAIITFPNIDLSRGGSFASAWLFCQNMVTFLPTNFASATSFDRAFETTDDLAVIGPINAPLCTNFTSMFRNAAVLNLNPLTDNKLTAATMNQFFLNTAMMNADVSNINVELTTTFTSFLSTCPAFKNSSMGQWWVRNGGMATFVTTDINSPASPTNLPLSAQDFPSANWTKTNLTSTANTATAPDGATTADSLTPSVTNSTDHSVKQTITVVNATAYTVRVALKADELTWGELICTGAITANIYVNLSTGAIESSSGTVTVTNIGSGWYVLEITDTTVSTSLVMQIKAWDNAAGTSFAGNASNNIFAWQASVFTGGSLTNYSTFLDNFVGMAGLTVPTTTGTTTAPVVNAPGTGYVVGDVLLLSGGTNLFDKTIEVVVATVDGLGGVLTVTLGRGDGNYTAQPTSPAATTGGTGTGCTITPTWVTKGAGMAMARALGMSTSKYSMKNIGAINARKFLLATKTWTITDGGPI